MKLLVTGANGQVGREILNLRAIEVVGFRKDALDVTDVHAVRKCIARTSPDMVVNAAAYTAVDLAESGRDQAFAVNRDGAHNVARVCRETGIPLLHLSTDYVFDGVGSAPYKESDSANPVNVYGKSKWQGEEAVRTEWDHSLILRTSWVFSEHGSNFVKAMLRLFVEKDELRIVDDQIGRPTAARDIASAILDIASSLTADFRHWGTYHFAGQPSVSWFEFANSIAESASNAGIGSVPTLVPVDSSAYPTAADRPRYTVLDTRRIAEVFGIQLPHWRNELDRVVRHLLGT